MAGRVLLLADVFPALSMPQADAGNLRVLEHRAAVRGIAVRSVTVQPGDPLPSADLYQVATANLRQLEAHEHTAQVPTKVRAERE